MIVVDASALGAVLLPDERSAMTDFLHDLLRSHPVVAPPHFGVEVASMIWSADRRGRLTSEEKRAASITAEKIVRRVMVTPLPPLEQLLSLAAKLQLTVYDAAFAHVATTHACPLVSLDTALVRAAADIGIELLRP